MNSGGKSHCFVASSDTIAGRSIIPADLAGSTLDLLRQPFVFTQASLLTESQFAAKARERGLTLERGELEQMHRRRVLVPFYQVHTRPVAEPEVRDRSQQAMGTEWQLYRASAESRISDPGARRFHGCRVAGRVRPSITRTTSCSLFGRCDWC